jgi:hypothetical protein
MDGVKNTSLPEVLARFRCDVSFVEAFFLSYLTLFWQIYIYFPGKMNTSEIFLDMFNFTPRNAMQ